METYTFVTAVILLMLAIQFGESWIVLGLVAVLILSLRSLSSTVLIIISLVVMYSVKSSEYTEYWPFVLFGLIIFALVVGWIGKGKAAETYSPYGGLLGGGQ